MAIDRFTKQQFEAALPVRKETKEKLWYSRGLVAGEYEYGVRVSDGVHILIRSSVRADGLAGDTGEDSIRCFLTDDTGSAISNKLSAYVTRVPGWADRLKGQLRQLWAMGRQVAKPCEACGKRRQVFVVKKAGPNKGRKFLRCECGSFQWIQA